MAHIHNLELLKTQTGPPNHAKSIDKTTVAAVGHFLTKMAGVGGVLNHEGPLKLH